MSDKLSRTIQRFQAKIDSGSFYEAHQTLRTIINRYVKAKQYKESIDLLYQGSVILSKNKEYTSASDLITYLIEVLKESGVTIEDQDMKLKLIELVNYLPNDNSNLPDLSKLIIEWSKTPTNKFGDSDLHSVFGVKFLNAIETTHPIENKPKVFSVGEFHCIFGNINSLNAYVDYLYNMSVLNANIDPGVYLSRAVINYSYLKNLEFVKLSIDKFLKKLIESKPYEPVKESDTEILYFEQYRLVNFVQLLYLTLGKKDSGNRFLKLYEMYKPYLKENEVLAPVEYLGRLYFNLQLGNPNNNQNMLANLMGGLFK